MASAPRPPSDRGQSGDKSGSPQTEIQRLLKTGIALFRADEDLRALDTFKKAFLLSSRLPEPHTQARCLFNLGAAYIATGKPKKGLKCTWKANKMATTENDGDFSFNVAAAYEAMREYAKAAEFYRKAVREYEDRKTPKAAEALVKLAYCLASTGDAASAAQSFRLAGQAYQKAQQPVDAAMALREAANYFLRSPDYCPEDVLEVLHGCSQICAGITNPELLGHLRNHLGLHYAEVKHFGLAEEQFVEALELCSRESVALRKRAVLLQNLGAVYNAQQESQRALWYHGEAANTYGVLGETAAQGQCLYNLASAHSQLGNHHNAQLHYQQAVKAFVDAGDSYGKAQGCEGLGTAHFCLGHPDLAVHYYKQALALFEKAKEASDVPRERILGKLADVASYQETLQSHNSHTGGFVDSGADNCIRSALKFCPSDSKPSSYAGSRLTATKGCCAERDPAGGLQSRSPGILLQQEEETPRESWSAAL